MALLRPEARLSETAGLRLDSRAAPAELGILVPGPQGLMVALARPT